MLTLKIRVPYKVGKPEDICKMLNEQFDYIDEVAECIVQDGTIVVGIENGHAPEKTLELRLLEVVE